MLMNNKKLGFHPKSKRTNTIPILFIDNLLIFCKGDINPVGLIKHEIEEFSLASVLCANVDKSIVYLVGVDEVS